MLTQYREFESPFDCRYADVSNLRPFEISVLEQRLLLDSPINTQCEIYNE